MQVRRAQLSAGGAARPRAGFTLIEILLVLAVVALVSALVLPGLGSIFRSLDHREPERVLWDTIIAARERALTANRTVWLSYDPDKKLLAWSDGTGGSSHAWPDEVGLTFLRAQAGATVLLGGQLVETEEIRGVRFYADGTCDRFRVQLRSGPSSARIIGVDPWTCAPVINEEASR